MVNNSETEEKKRQAGLETERKKCRDALAEFSPSVYDISKYLSAEEQEQYMKSIEGAIEAFYSRNTMLETQHPGYWLSHPSAAACGET